MARSVYPSLKPPATSGEVLRQSSPTAYFIQRLGKNRSQSHLITGYKRMASNVRKFFVSQSIAANSIRQTKVTHYLDMRGDPLRSAIKEALHEVKGR